MGTRQIVRAGWIGAGVLWVVFSAASVLARDGEQTTAYVVGGFTGRLLGSLALALLLRWLYVKARGGDRLVWHPWALLIAAVISLLTLGVRTADALACQDADPVQAKALLSDPPSGYRVQDVPETDARDILEQFPQESRDDIAAVTAVAAVKGDQAVVVTALTSANERLDPDEELRGFRQSAQAEVEEIEVGGETGAIQVLPEGALAVGTAGDCGAVLVVGQAEQPVREIAPALTLPD